MGVATNLGYSHLCQGATAIHKSLGAKGEICNGHTAWSVFRDWNNRGSQLRTLGTSHPCRRPDEAGGHASRRYELQGINGVLFLDWFR